MRSDRLRRFGLALPALTLVVFGSACNRSKGAGAASAPAAGPTSATARADALLLAATKVALPPPGIAPGDLPEPATPGAQLMAKYCIQCHSLPSPAMHSATDWPRVLRRMWLRMDRLPDSFEVRTADEGDRITLLGYVTANALRVSGTELPAGAGREDFAVTCSRCHALPDIRIHSSADWPAVFLRMESNMDRMSVSRPSQDAAGRILLYLQKAGQAP